MGSRKPSGLIKLAENPDDEEYFDDDDGYGDGDELGDDGGDAEGEMEDTEMKGRRVVGPRTKLASADRLGRIENSVSSLAKAVNAIARVQKAIIEKDMDEDDVDGLDGYEDDDDDDDDGDGGGGDESRLDMNRNVKKAKMKKAKTKASSTVAKDDAASSFGEKDDDTPGNRPFDQTGVGDDDTVIQGGPGAGPGPISKSREAYVTRNEMRSMIRNAVRESLGAAGLTAIHKADGPMIDGPSSKIDKSAEPVDLSDLFVQMKDRSFKQINSIREEIGDLPRGWSMQ